MADHTVDELERLSRMCSNFFGERLAWAVARIRELEATVKRQAASATMGIDAAKGAAAEYYRLGKQALDEAGRLAASTSFDELKSQREANAILTEENERLASRVKELECALPARDGSYYGKDCPVGMVQVEFVGCSPQDRYSEYGWKPTKSASLEVYVDGKRFRIEVGDFHDGRAQRRGLHIVGGHLNMNCEMTSMNACSVWYGERPVRETQKI